MCVALPGRGSEGWQLLLDMLSCGQVQRPLQGVPSYDVARVAHFAGCDPRPHAMAARAAIHALPRRPLPPTTRSRQLQGLQLAALALAATLFVTGYCVRAVDVEPLRARVHAGGADQTLGEPHMRSHPLSELAANLRRVSVSPQLPPVRLSANASAFRGDGAVVNVTWDGVLYPTRDDIVALYVPAHADPSQVVPVQFAKCADAASGEHMQHGRGWFT
eukprot:351652-Chlamydomonas_euryale.AAC.2